MSIYIPFSHFFAHWAYLVKPNLVARIVAQGTIYAETITVSKPLFPIYVLLILLKAPSGKICFD